MHQAKGHGNAMPQRAPRYEETLELAEAIADECRKPVVNLTTVRTLAAAMQQSATETTIALRAINGISEAFAPSEYTVQWAKQVTAQRRAHAAAHGDEAA